MLSSYTTSVDVQEQQLFIRSAMSLGTNIRTLMDHYDCTYASVAESCGTSEQTIQQLVARDSKRSSFALPIAAYFSVPLEILLTGTRDELLSKSQNPKTQQRSKIDSLSNSFQVNEKSAPTYIPGIPVIATIRLADRECFFMSVVKGDGLGFVQLPSIDSSSYAIQMYGQEFSPRIRHGEYLVVEPRLTPGPGDEVVVKLNGEEEVRLGVYTFTANGLCHFEGLVSANGSFQAYEQDIEYIRVISAITKSNLISGRKIK